MGELSAQGESEQCAACDGETVALQRNIARQTVRGYARPHVSFVQAATYSLCSRKGQKE